MNSTDVLKNLQKPEDAPPEPMALFADWLADAGKTEPCDPNAMCLSTLGPDGKISSRIVLLKDSSPRGFIFYTNMESRKGAALAANPVAALNFYWKSLGRQIRIEGNVEKLSAAESDAYFATRPHGSRIGAWASEQSRPLESRAALQERVKTFEEKFKDLQDIPRPPHWGGYIVIPERIEFWHEGAFRLHTRVVYQRSANGWDKQMLFP